MPFRHRDMMLHAKLARLFWTPLTEGLATSQILMAHSPPACRRHACLRLLASLKKVIFDDITVSVEKSAKQIPYFMRDKSDSLILSCEAPIPYFKFAKRQSLILQYVVWTSLPALALPDYIVNSRGHGWVRDPPVRWDRRAMSQSVHRTSLSMVGVTG